MVKLDKIYTRGGDTGLTSLGDGERVAKHSPRPAAFGTIDEANAVIGLARLQAPASIDAILGRVQNDLFDLGADLCTPERQVAKSAPLRIVLAQVERLEAEIDALNASIPPIASFVLPGGTATAAWLHLARTVVRRAERLACALAETEAVNPQAIAYLNRLSDHLFVLARHANNDGASDVAWVPGKHRDER